MVVPGRLAGSSSGAAGSGGGEMSADKPLWREVLKKYETEAAYPPQDTQDAIETAECARIVQAIKGAFVAGGRDVILAVAARERHLLHELQEELGKIERGEVEL
jgi:hypothetical protein